MFVCPSFSMEQLGSHWRDCDENWYLSIFPQSVEKIQSDMKIYVHLGQYLAQFLFEWEMFQTFWKKFKTHFAFSTIFFFSENLAVYEIMWRNIVEPGRPQMTIWRTHIACWISKATKTHSQYVILFAFPLQQRLQERASVLRLYVHWLSYSVYMTAVGPGQARPYVGSGRTVIAEVGFQSQACSYGICGGQNDTTTDFCSE
jgi:hypothetical protein